MPKCIYIYIFICILNGYFNSNIIHTWWTQTMNLPFGDDISTYLHPLTVVSGMVCFWGLTRLAKTCLTVSSHCGPRRDRKSQQFTDGLYRLSPWGTGHFCVILVEHPHEDVFHFNTHLRIMIFQLCQLCFMSRSAQSRNNQSCSGGKCLPPPGWRVS